MEERASDIRHGGDQHGGAGATAGPTPRPKVPTSRYRGLTWDRQDGRWRVRINYGAKQQHVGRFADEVEAARAYDRAAVHLLGPTARLNFSPEAALADTTPMGDTLLLLLERHRSELQVPLSPRTATSQAAAAVAPRRKRSRADAPTRQPSPRPLAPRPTAPPGGGWPSRRLAVAYAGLLSHQQPPAHGTEPSAAAWDLGRLQSGRPEGPGGLAPGNGSHEAAVAPADATRVRETTAADPTRQPVRQQPPQLQRRQQERQHGCVRGWRAALRAWLKAPGRQQQQQQQQRRRRQQQQQQMQMQQQQPH